VYAAILSILPLLSLGAENSTALKALDALPVEEVKNLVRIEAYDGSPLPERWHFLIHDPNTPSGVREYVVAGGELVVARGISQFADRLKQTDVIGNQALKIDSDKLARLAKEYGAVNEITVAKVSYHLHKRPETAEPVWRVNCYDHMGKAIGALVVTASGGTVVTHDGFAEQPQTNPTENAKSLAATDWSEDSEDPPAKTRSSSSNATSTSRKSSATQSSGQKKTTASVSKRSSERRSERSASSRSSSRPEARPAYVAEPPPIRVRERRNPFQNLFRRFAR
jgi:hypothetical protein